LKKRSVKLAFYIERFKNIKKIDYDVEVITPMFLGGADAKGAELRIPPFKGMLRYCWRAIYVNLVKNNNDFSMLKSEESKLFGDAGEYAGKSNVIISVDYNNIQIGSFNPLPHKVNNKFQFKGIKPGQQFTITLSAQEKIHKLFELVTFLSGFGKRSRRGFGSIKIKRVNDKEYIDDFSDVNKILELIKSVNDIYQLDNVDNEKIVVRQSYNANYPFLKSIQLGKDCNTYDELLKKIGEASHNHNSDYTGFAKGQKRLASPLYISTIKTTESEKYKPIISTLNTVFEKSYNPTGHDTINDFIKCIS
jgi:CRISPR-associated protein Cmr1